LGVVAEIVRGASSVAQSMRDHPFVLALVITNVGLMLIVWIEITMIFHQQSEINALLSKCVDPEVLRSLGLFK